MRMRNLIATFHAHYGNYFYAMQSEQCTSSQAGPIMMSAVTAVWLLVALCVCLGGEFLLSDS